MRNPAEIAADAAEAFVCDHLDPAIGETPEGRVALMYAVVDRLFFDAAYHDKAGDMDTAEKCLEVARQAVARGRAG